MFEFKRLNKNKTSENFTCKSYVFLFVTKYFYSENEEKNDRPHVFLKNTTQSKERVKGVIDQTRVVREIGQSWKK